MDWSVPCKPAHATTSCWSALWPVAALIVEWSQHLVQNVDGHPQLNQDCPWPSKASNSSKEIPRQAPTTIEGMAKLVDSQCKRLARQNHIGWLISIQWTCHASTLSSRTERTTQTTSLGLLDKHQSVDHWTGTRRNKARSRNELILHLCKVHNSLFWPTKISRSESQPSLTLWLLVRLSSSRSCCMQLVMD